MSGGDPLYPWAWDDEDTARPPYIHIWNDDGGWALPYRTRTEQQQLSKAAAEIVESVNAIILLAKAT